MHLGRILGPQHSHEGMTSMKKEQNTGRDRIRERGKTELLRI